MCVKRNKTLQNLNHNFLFARTKSYFNLLTRPPLINVKAIFYRMKENVDNDDKGYVKHIEKTTIFDMMTER